MCIRDRGYRGTWGRKLVRQAGGVRPRLVVSGRYLTFPEREQIALWRVERVGVREIARRLGRSPSTISRELTRNSRPSRHRYLASVAQAKADQRGQASGVLLRASHSALVEVTPR